MLSAHPGMVPYTGILRPVDLFRQEALPGMEKQLPFPAMTMDMKRYKVLGIVTNKNIEGNELINWLYERCGKSEEAHSIMKEDLAGGRLPSSDFGENAAWVVDHGPCTESQYGNETTDLEGIMEDKKNEGTTFLPHRPARENH
jgi:hypothetical protein